MWSKGEEPAGKRSSRNQAVAARSASGPPPRGSEQAVIGRSIAVQGDVTGDEDLLIRGRVEGSVALGEQTVTVGSEGRVKASITARTITVEGTVEGDLAAGEYAVLRSSARVEGDIRAPRVILEDGAEFRGGVEMSNGGVEAGEAPGNGNAGSGAEPKEKNGRSKAAGGPSPGTGPSEPKAAGERGG